ncbi:hypothetical protein EJ08DRAFT_584174 [Tothia fuscella]|uniref:G domain-containing protein n=1 Tax=Tothia fuscella TaxID=1048955 RepID=A0A9P4U054_9PEZI|nr:hypothetical protein EJ08DRAFT_584174 [Tothia fuscella]
MGSPTTQANPLPLSCPGCGAPTQTVLPDEAGYYTSTRRGLKKLIKPAKVEEQKVLDAALQKIGKRRAAKLGLQTMAGIENGKYTQDSAPEVPICDRCHHLLHHRTGVSIAHPSLQSISDTINESPHKYNHIYHVLDAADFPLSLLPNLHKTLDAHLRSRGRRTQEYKYKKDKAIDMSFIITRSDLLAPRKEMVDSMMPILLEILRDALGATGENVRLGNVRCVSSKRGWWTKEVKESIWERGGGGWLVGKANVGKSNLFQSVYPKGWHEETPNFDRIRNEARNQPFQLGVESDALSSLEPLVAAKPECHAPSTFDDTLSLLPPAQPESKYPMMPIISELPGTTASPIRIPFGNGKGELIDLPGLSRPTLEPYVKTENAFDIIMKKRVSPERIVMKPSSSVLLGGGLIRITPKTPDQIFMLHAFVPLETHLTSTLKVEAITAGERGMGINSVLKPECRHKIRSAGTFKLITDVTRRYAGALTRKDAVGLNPSRLPFIVYSTDILIEGCGWVEIVAQVRKPKMWDRDALGEMLGETPPEAPFPEVEVFSPEGKFVGQRRTLGAWLLAGPREKKVGERKGRPRVSMGSVRKSREGRGLGM